MVEDTVRAAGNVAVLEESAHLGGRSLVGHPTNLTREDFNNVEGLGIVSLFTLLLCIGGRLVGNL